MNFENDTHAWLRRTLLAPLLSLVFMGAPCLITASGNVRVVQSENFDTATLPTSLGLGSQGGGLVELISDPAQTYGGTGKSLKVTYPAQASGSGGGVFAWGGVNVASYETDHVYIRFRAKMPAATHGLKFIKVFGQNNGHYANTTFGLDYTGVDLGSMYATSFGDGTSLDNDTQSVMNFDGSYPAWVGRSYGLPGFSVSTPQGKKWASSDWGTGWHLFELYVKFNSGTSAANETNDGACLVRVDGKTYLDARGIYNRHYSNPPIDAVAILNWSQRAGSAAAPSFEIWYDNFEVTLGGWNDSPADTQAPSVPSNLQLTSASSNSLTLNWTASADNIAVTRYDIYRDAALVGNTVSAQYTLTGLSSGTAYNLTVKAIDAAGNVSALSVALPAATTGSNALAKYDFTAGDSLAAKNGWAFESTSWPLQTVPGTSAVGLPFTFTKSVPGNYASNEKRFTMPPTDDFWIKFRWHVPANYLHRHDTFIGITSGQRANWQLGDVVRGTDGTSSGTISCFTADGLYLRYAHKSSYNDIWIGTVTNVTRNATASSTARSQWGANNKLLAVWADGYSASGLGSTIVWQTDLQWPNDTDNHSSVITVAYSTGGNQGTSSSGSVAVGGTIIEEGDAGKYIDLIFHGKFSTGQNTNDGVIQTWARKQGATTYTQEHNITNANMNKRTDVAANLRPWQTGYLMGWSNSGYDQDTAFYLSSLEYFNTTPSDFIVVPSNAIITTTVK